VAARGAGPGAATLVIESALDAYPLAKNLPFQATQLEVSFWQELRHGRVRAARIIAGKLTAMPNPHGRTEFDFRRAPPAPSRAWCRAALSLREA